MALIEEEIEQIKQRIDEMRLEHRDLDVAIAHLEEQTYIDQLQIRRMKKRKLLLKDMVGRFESMLIPDLPA